MATPRAPRAVAVGIGMILSGAAVGLFVTWNAAMNGGVILALLLVLAGVLLVRAGEGF